MIKDLTITIKSSTGGTAMLERKNGQYRLIGYDVIDLTDNPLFFGYDRELAIDCALGVISGLDDLIEKYTGDEHDF